MRLINELGQTSSKTCQVVRRTKREVALPHFLRSVTSLVMVSLCLRKCQNTCENSRGPWPRTVASLWRLTANLSWLLSSCRSFNNRPPDLLLNVTATNDTLQSICFHALPCGTSSFTEAAKAPPTIFPPIY